jgi:hypothetical protein
MWHWHYVASSAGKMEWCDCARCCDAIPNNAETARALHIAIEQAKAQPIKVRMRPFLRSVENRAHPQRKNEKKHRRAPRDALPNGNRWPKWSEPLK